ncbi:MAG: 30S ribosomal protein S8 [Verrucomicrobia bacterium]|jgi:small subunit ribosomal protein S8|nr:30S ribosomal protein S8 [Verrucomicrobiota bacterium]MDA1204503.1 30S ribosomal protein S8 [Verrucomicrobiota bacterium]
MTSNDPIADLLTRLRNSTRVRKAELLVPYSRMKADISAILKKEGYITDFEVKSEGKPQLRIVNKFAGKTPAITGLKRVSRPGLRRYVGAEDIPRVLGGMGISIISTPRGVLSGREARRQKVGGELLAYVW